MGCDDGVWVQVRGCFVRVVPPSDLLWASIDIDSPHVFHRQDQITITLLKRQCSYLFSKLENGSPVTKKLWIACDKHLSALSWADALSYCSRIKTDHQCINKN